MKKIRFGSFPLIDVPRQDRDCIDKYSIKNYSDLITLNSAVRSSSDSADKYITPYSIYKYFKNPQLLDALSNSGKDNQGPDLLKDKALTMQRAFKSLREISINIQNIPFYADKVAFPIYLEHKSNAKNDYDYDFLLLTNDLVDKQILDEIHYDDNVTMMFLVMKDIMYARTPLSMLGITGDTESDIKRDFAQFLELCKQHGKNPLDIFINIIKIIGHNKATTGNTVSVTSRLTGMASAATSRKLTNLFNHGEIKDATFMLQAIKQDDIAKFLDETAHDNASTHGGNVNRLQNIRNQMSPEAAARANEASTTITTQLEREYLLNKTHDYNEVLSVVSAMLAFNKNDKIIDDVNDGSLSFNLNSKADSETTDLKVNADAIIDKLRQYYFDAFVKALINYANILFGSFEDEAVKNLPNDIKGFVLKSRKNTFELEKQGDKTNQIRLNQHYAEIDTLKELIKNESAKGSYADQNTIETYSAGIDREYMAVKNLQNNMMLDHIVNDGKNKSTKNETDNIRKFRFEENIESIQGSLVSLLNDLESHIYDKDSLQKIIYAMSSNDPVSIKALIDDFAYSLEIISSEIMMSYENSFRNEVTELYSYFNISIEDLENNVFSKLEINGKVKTQLIEKMNIALKSIMQNIYRDFGSKVSQSKMIYAQGRAERNPVIKQTITKSNNFKTFIISQKILLDLYDILSYIDGQKYIAGLLRFPPSKIYGDIARMKYILERIGLTTNPVFIIDEVTKSVTLSSPDMLSLTGTPLFSKITRDQMKAICFIDYNKDLWNSDKIMEQYTQKNNIKKNDDLKSKITKLSADIKKITDDKKATPEQRKQVISKQNEKRKLEEELAKLNASSSRGVTLSTSLNGEQNAQIRSMDSARNPEPTSYPQTNYVPREQYAPIRPQYQPPVEYPTRPQVYPNQYSQQVQQPQVPRDNNYSQGQGYIQRDTQTDQNVQSNQGHMYPQIQPRRSWNNPYKKDF